MIDLVELRCDQHLHLKLDPVREVVEVKCAQCSKDQKRPVYHRWPLREILERYRAGDVNGSCQPTEPEFVHWRVSAA